MKPEYKTIMVPMEDGTEKEAGIISFIRVEELNKKFLIYTFGEEDDNGMDVLHVSEVVEDENGSDIELKEVEENDWSIVKDFLRESIRSEEARA
jgi:hypothetical protein